MKIGDVNKRTEETLFFGSTEIRVIKIVRKIWFLRTFNFLERKIPGKLGLLVALIGKLLPNLFCRELLREVRSLRPDLVHQHDYLANLIASKCLSDSIPVVFTNHTGQYLFLEKFRLTRKLQRYFLSHYQL